MRDTIKSKEYFERWISYVHGEIKLKQARIDSGEIPAAYGRALASFDIFRKALEIPVMRYSMGCDLLDIKRDMPLLMQTREQLKTMCDSLAPNEQKDRAMFERLSFDNYTTNLWWLSLAVCLEMDGAYTSRALALIGNAGKDALLDTFVRKIDAKSTTSTNKLLFPKQYTHLLESIDAPPDQQAVLLKRFVEGWYKGNRNLSAWHDNHLGDDTGYIGYWCFEAALAVKLFGLDDSQCRPHPHYPRDLVRAVE